MAYLWLVTSVLLAVSSIALAHQGPLAACMRYIDRIRNTYCGNEKAVQPRPLHANEVNMLDKQPRVVSEARRRKHDADPISECCFRACSFNEIFRGC